MGELSIEVMEGLKGDEKIVTGPFKALRTLKPGDPVRKEKEPPKGTAGRRRGDRGPDDGPRRAHPRSRSTRSAPTRCAAS